LNGTRPLDVALRLLARRDRGERELAGHLRRKGCDETDIATVLQRCRELGYLDEDRFARHRAKTLMTSGRAVGGRLLAELKRQGIEEELAHQAASEAETEIDRNQLLADLLARRFAGFSYEHADDRQRRRVIHYFLRRGFSLEQILARCKNPGT